MAPKSTAPAITSPATSVVFADLEFKSRTIVLGDGRGFPVEKGRITATDPALIEHLDRRDDFKRIEG